MEYESKPVGGCNIMETLWDYDDHKIEIASRQPVSKALLGNLQARALNGDLESDLWLKKHIVALGYYITIREIETKHLDKELVLKRILISDLEELRFVRSFTEWHNDDPHVDVVEDYISHVIDDLYYTIPLINLMLKKTDYESIKATREMILERDKAEPTPQILSHETGYSEEIVTYVQRKELDKSIRIIQKDLDRIRYYQLVQLIGKSPDLNCKKEKFESLYANIEPRELRILYYHFGVDDGISKVLEDTACHFNLSLEEAEGIFCKLFDFNESG